MKSLCFSSLVLTLVFSASPVVAQTEREPWTAQQLMAPADLARIITTDTQKPVIFCVGPANYIPGAVNIGPMTEQKNVDALKRALKKLPKDAAIVIYCGCCPFEHCPNIRPAMDILNKLKFTNQKLLNLSHNAKVDWLEKGYPSE